MIGLGLLLLISIFISFFSLIGGIRSLLSIGRAYDSESRLMAIMGFIGGILISAYFGWVTIMLSNKLEAMHNVLMQ
jgi:hypothetical protein